MAIAFVNSVDGGHTTTASSYTFSYTIGSGANRLLVVTATGASTDNITGATYNGVSMTLQTKLLSASTRWVYFFYLLESSLPSAGAYNVIITASGVSDFIFGGVSEYTGVAQVGQPDAFVTNATTVPGPSLTTSITTVTDNDWVILLAEGFNNNADPTGGAGATFRSGDGSFGIWGLFDSNGAVTPPGSYSMTVSYNASGSFNNISVQLAAFSPSVVVIVNPEINYNQPNPTVSTRPSIDLKFWDQHYTALRLPVPAEAFFANLDFPNPRGYKQPKIYSWVQSTTSLTFPVPQTTPLYPKHDGFPNPRGLRYFDDGIWIVNFLGLSTAPPASILLMPQIWM